MKATDNLSVFRSQYVESVIEGRAGIDFTDADIGGGDNDIAWSFDVVAN
jgi:hypothetical protein